MIGVQVELGSIFPFSLELCFLVSRTPVLRERAAIIQ
jgi:hypothetical protein